MDRVTMVTEVRRRLGEDAEDFFDTDDIIRALDNAVQKFAHETDWSWLQSFQSTSFLADATTFALPTDLDINRIVSARVVIGTEQPYKLQRVTASDGFRLMNRYTSKAHPQWYFVYTTAQAGGAQTATARLVPQADVGGAVEFLYYRRPAALSADTSEPDIPEDYQDAIPSYATAKLWMQDDPSWAVKITEQMAIYQSILETAIRSEGKLGDDEELAIGKMDDEAERAGLVAPFNLPANYGWPEGVWGVDD